MAKKYTTFFSYILLPMLLLSNGSLRAGETDSLFQQLPEIFTSTTTLYISNTEIYIARNTDITLTGDLTLNNSDILGQGSLILKSKQNQTIKSKNSTISNLEIRNSQTVALIGDLAITQTLVIDTGIFDISKGDLEINQNSIRLLHQGSIYTGQEAQIKNASGTVPIAQADSLTASQYNIISQKGKAIFGFSKKTPLFFKEQHYSNTTQNLLLQPPRLA